MLGMDDKHSEREWPQRPNSSVPAAVRDDGCPSLAGTPKLAGVLCAKPPVNPPARKRRLGGEGRSGGGKMRV